MLTFCNNYPQLASVCIMWYSPGCPDGGDWERAGWWNLNPGECQNVFDADLDEINRYYLFYAEATDGAFWAGPYVRSVTDSAFDLCEGDGTSQRDVGFRLFDIGDNDDYTMTLVP
jgi:uncharacterized membrane protein